MFQFKIVSTVAINCLDQTAIDALFAKVEILSKTDNSGPASSDGLS